MRNFHDQILNLASENQLRLKCEAIGTSPINFRWFQNEAPLVADRGRKGRIKIRNRQFHSVLRIKPVQILDKGYYRCEASNFAGTVKTEARMDIVGRPPQGPSFPASGGGAGASDSIFDGSFSSGGELIPNSDHHQQQQQVLNTACIQYSGSICAQHIGQGTLIFTNDSTVIDSRGEFS